MDEPASYNEEPTFNVRQEVLAKRDLLSDAQRTKLSSKVTENLKTIPQYLRTNLPLFYISFRSEVDTHALIQDRLSKGFPVAAPITKVKERKLEIRLIKEWDRDLQVGAYGILEPVPETTETVEPGDIDLVIVPGSVFDLQCGRYGYGGGFYDRFLSKYAPQACRIGLAYELQVVQKLKLKSHDQKMDIIVTESRIIQCRP